jgi:hypothetical protein
VSELRFVHPLSIEGQESAGTRAAAILREAIVPVYDVPLARMAAADAYQRRRGGRAGGDTGSDSALQASAPTLRRSFSPHDLQ